MLPPTISLKSGVIGINQNLLASSLISVVSDDAPVTLYEIRDNGLGGGYFELDGQRQNARAFFEVTPDQLSLLVYRGASRASGESFTVRATNQFGVSVERTAGIATGNRRPVVTGTDTRVISGQAVALSDLISFSDADGDAAVRYGFVDRSTAEGSGRLYVGEVPQEQAKWFFVAASDLGRVTYRGGMIGGRQEQLGVLVSDGLSFSDISRFTVRTQGKAIVTPDRTELATAGERIAAEDLFNVIDPDGDRISLYYIVDRLAHSSSGYFEFKGQRMPDAKYIKVFGDELDELVYVAGDGTIRTENVGIIAYDGYEFSDVVNLPVRMASLSPIEVDGTDTTLDFEESVSVASLLNVNGLDGEPITRYWFVDRNNSEDGGYFEVDGNRKESAKFFSVTPDVIDSVIYRGGTINETENVGVLVQVGSRKSPIVDFRISTNEPEIVKPTLDLAAVKGKLGTSFSLSEMFTASSQFQRFGVYDTNAGEGSGYFSVNGERQDADQWLRFTADEVDLVRYHVGDTPGSEIIRMFIAADGVSSEISSVTTEAFEGAEIAPVRNSISIDTLETIALGDLFNKVDGGEAHTKYQVMVELEGLSAGVAGAGDRAAQVLDSGQRLERGMIYDFTAEEYGNLLLQGAEADFGRNLSSIIVRAGNEIAGFSDWKRVNVNTDPVGIKSLEIIETNPITMEMESLELIGLDSAVGATNDGRRIFTYTFIDGGNQDGSGTVMNPAQPPLPTYYAGDPGDPANGIEPIPAMDEANGTLALSQPQREAIRRSFRNIESYLNVQFVEQPYEFTAANSQFVFGARRDTGAAAYAYLPVPGDNGLGNIVADIWYDSEVFDPRGGGDTSVGSQFMATTLHEIGHALGMKHPFEGDLVLSIFNNFEYNTVMAYLEDGEFNNQGRHPEAPSTLALYDVQYLQSVYGANTTFNADDTVYTYDVSHQQTLWDAGGIDTIDLSSHTVAETVDLREGTFSTLYGIPLSLRIAYGTTIENAMTGSGDDSLRGNEVANSLYGGRGNDLLVGGGGDDQLFGEIGSDVYRWTLGDGNDIITERGAEADFLEIHDPSGNLDSLQDDFMFSRLGNDLRIGLNFNQGEEVGTIDIKEFASRFGEVETLRFFGGDGLQIGEDIDLVSVFQASDDTMRRFRATSSATANGLVAVPV